MVLQAVNLRTGATQCLQKSGKRKTTTSIPTCVRTAQLNRGKDKMPIFTPVRFTEVFPEKDYPVHWLWRVLFCNLKGASPAEFFNGHRMLLLPICAPGCPPDTNTDLVKRPSQSMPDMHTFRLSITITYRLTLRYNTRWCLPIIPSTGIVPLKVRFG